MTKVVTGKVRFSFCHLFEPQEPLGGGEPKYSVTLLIPKKDTATLGKIKEAMAQAREAFCSKNGANALPAKPSHTLHDGDGVRESGEPFGDECKGHYVLKVSTKQKPLIIDNFKNDITDPNEVYSGCYGRASIKFFGYNANGKKGLSAVLLGIQKLHDGTPFGTVASADDFDDDFTDGENDDDFLG